MGRPRRATDTVNMLDAKVSEKTLRICQRAIHQAQDRIHKNAYNQGCWYVSRGTHPALAEALENLADALVEIDALIGAV